MSYSRILTEAISIGLTANLISERMVDVRATGFAIYFGVIYRNLGDVNGLSVSVVLKNLGTEKKFNGSGLYQQGQITGVNRSPKFYLVDVATFEIQFNFQLADGYSTVLDEQKKLLFTGIYQNDNFLVVNTNYVGNTGTMICSL
jgi:hypothetical protein